MTVRAILPKTTVNLHTVINSIVPAFAAAILILLISFFPFQLFAQNITKTPLEKMYADVDYRISDTEREEIITAVQSLLDRYVYSCNFADADGNFDVDKYLIFTDELFYSSATITNYILKKPVNIELSKYAEFIYDKISPASLDLRLNRMNPAQIEKIDINASGNYLVSMSIYQDLYSVYDVKNEILNHTARPVKIKYDTEIVLERGYLSDAKFIKMTGEIKGSAESESYLSIAPYYGFGMLSKSSGNGFVNISPGISSYGIWADVIRSLDKKEKLFLWLGLNAGFFSVVSDFTDKYTSPLSENFKDKLEVTKYTENGFINSTVESDVTIQSIDSGAEKINGANIFSGQVGIGYRFNVGIQNMLTLKLGLSPTYVANMSKGSRTTEFIGIEMPAGKSNFPDYSELPDDIRHLYSFIPAGENIPGNEKLITAENNFSLSVIFAPSFQIPIGHGWGIDIGAAMSYGINGLFKHTNNDKAFLSRDNESVSIIQDYLQNSQIRHFQITAGIYYRL